MEQMTLQDAMLRPVLMVRAAAIGARHYRRRRDLPTAVPGLLAEPLEALLPRLAREEAALEARRRSGAADYRPGRHLQVLAALLAECRDAGLTPAAVAREAAVDDQANAFGSRSFRSATKSRNPSSIPGSIAGR